MTPIDKPDAALALPPGTQPIQPPIKQPLTPAVRNALLSLDLSRAALRHELLPPAPPPQQAGASSGWARRWLRRLRAWPIGRTAADVAQQWWQAHPWRPVGDTLWGESRSALGSAVRRHPWASVTAAATLAACVVAARPWRWPWLHRHVSRAPMLASGWLMHQLKTAPVQAALAGVVATVAQQLQALRRQPPAPDASPEGADPVGVDPEGVDRDGAPQASAFPTAASTAPRRNGQDHVSA